MATVDQQKLLEQAGEALYGSRWQSELSRGVGVADRTMRRWIAEPHQIPFGVWKDIQQLLLDRIVAIEKVRQNISGAMLDAPDA